MLHRRVLIGLLASAPFAAQAAPTPYRLEVDRSTVGFTYYFGAHPATGTMPIQAADLALDFDQVSRSRVAVTLDATRARTGFALATEALKSRSMLDTETHPTLNFVAREIAGGGTQAQLIGDLTLRGVTRPMTLGTTLYRQADTDVGDRSRLSLLLTGSLDRRAWGVTGYEGLVGPQVDLRILARISRS